MGIGLDETRWGTVNEGSISGERPVDWISSNENAADQRYEHRLCPVLMRDSEMGCRCFGIAPMEDAV